jgi:TonB family protein
VQAATAGGTITAWFNPDSGSPGSIVHLTGASQLSSGAGDIIVFLPRNLAVNVDAIIESGGANRIDVDPALPMTFQPPGNRAPGPLHATAVLNGGGALLKLRTTVGKIRLQFLDSDTGLRESLIREQRERINRRRDPETLEPVKALTIAPAPEEAPSAEEKSDWLERWMDLLESRLLGGLQEDAGDFQKRLISSPRPAYPELARRTGIQGIVKLQVRVTTNGSIEVQKLLKGEPVLADAAIDAVKRWRAKPASINGRKVEVVSTVTFNFQLH